MMKKAVEHQAAQHVQARLAGMSLDEQVQYFHERTHALRELQQRLIVERAAQRTKG
jgi:hypothetical protein